MVSLCFPPCREGDRWSTPGGRPLVGLSMTVLLCLAAGGAAHAECPASTVAAVTEGTTSVSHTTSVPRDEVGRSDGGTSCSDYCYSWSEQAGGVYDLAAGTTRAFAYIYGPG